MLYEYVVVSSTYVGMYIYDVRLTTIQQKLNSELLGGGVQLNVL